MVGASPLSLVARIFTTILTYTEAHSRLAIEKLECVDVSLEKSCYTDSKTLFLEAEKVIFGSPDVSIFPIYAGDSGQLVAVFPTRHRVDLEPFLVSNQKAIAERFLLSRNRFKRLFTLLTKPRQVLAYGEAGEFVGGVLKSMFMEP